MTLPTTRIDTLSPEEQSSPPGSYFNTNGSSQSQEILLVDFVPNGAGRATSTSSTSTNSKMTLHGHSQIHGANSSNSTKSHLTNHNSENINMFQSGYQHQVPPVQVQPVTLKNNDLSNFTLVNLSNQNGDEDPDDQERLQTIVNQPHYRRSRSSISSGGGEKQFKQFHNFHTVNIGNLSSSMSSSSNDSDTGFLVPQNGIKAKGRFLGKDKDKQYQKQSSLPLPLPSGSPGFNSPVQQANRKRLRRRRSSGRRKQNSNTQESLEASDLFPLCCCFGEGDQGDNQSSSRGSNSLASKYLRFSCIIVMIIFITTFTSIMVSLQRKVDSLSSEVNKWSNGAGSHLTEDNPTGTGPDSGSSQDNRNSNISLTQMQDIILKQEQLNSSYILLKAMLDGLSQKVSKLEKQPSVEDVTKNLARLGSDVQGSIQDIKQQIENLNLKMANVNPPTPLITNVDQKNSEGGQTSVTATIPVAKSATK